jgi:hypothetical protein
MDKQEHWTEGFDSFIGRLVGNEKNMGTAIHAEEVAVHAKPEVVEVLARFAHEGLPYMTGDENWFDFNKDWAVNVWWNWEEMAYRATAYRKLGEGDEVTLDLKHGLDLF